MGRSEEILDPFEVCWNTAFHNIGNISHNLEIKLCCYRAERAAELALSTDMYLSDKLGEST